MVTNLTPTKNRIFNAKYTIEAGDIDTVGYATISNAGSLGTFASATVSNIIPNTYDLDVTIDGGALRQLAVALLASDTWAQIAAKLQTALRTATGALETVAIASGRIKITSVTTGATSSVLIAAGTLGSAGGNLLTAITAIGDAYVAQIDAAVAGTFGYATISNTGSLGAFTGATVPALATNNYALDITMNGGALRQLVLAIVNTDDWTTIVGKIQTALRTATGALETVVIDAGKIKVSSVTLGAVSSVLIAAGTGAAAGGDLLAAITALGATYIATLDAPVAGTAGAQTLSNIGSLAAFTGATVPALPSATYDLDVTVDGGALRQLAVALLISDSWTSIAAKIQTALRAATTSTETVAIVADKIKITSAQQGGTSSILIAAGTAGSGGGNLIAAITALGSVGTTYVATLDTPVAGVYGSVTVALTSNITSFTDFAGKVVIKTSAGIDKIANIVKSYTAGNLTVTNTATSIATGDVITILGILY